jgi:hypothetical protein
MPVILSGDRTAPLARRRESGTDEPLGVFKSPGSQSSTARDRFPNREEPFGGGSNRSICPIPYL